MSKDDRAVANSLKKVCDTKIQTTMIGALAAIEDALGELWNHGSKHRTSEQEEWYNIYTELRSRILDIGNTQKRNLEKDFEAVDVQIRMVTYNMQVKPRPRVNTEQDN